MAAWRKKKRESCRDGPSHLNQILTRFLGILRSDSAQPAARFTLILGKPPRQQFEF